MQSEGSAAKIIRVISPFIYLIQDQGTKEVVKLALEPCPKLHYHHLLLKMVREPVTYVLKKKSKLREQERKGYLYLNGVDITSLYRQEQIQKQIHVSQSEGNQKLEKQQSQQQKTTLICFVSKVQCLKFELLLIESGKQSEYKAITFYFSQLKLIRLTTSHPKQQWQRAHHHFKSQFQGLFVELHIAGKQKYKQQINVYGDIYGLISKEDLKQKLIESGYACISNNASKYISEGRIHKFNQIASQAKQSQKGIYEKEKKQAKASNQATEIKYKQWETYVKQEKLIKQVRQEEEQRNILEQLQKQVGSKAQYQKIKILTEVIMTLYSGANLNQISMRFLSECTKITSALLSHCQISLYSNIANMDYLKLICRLIIFNTFYLQLLQKEIQSAPPSKNKSIYQKSIESEGNQFEKIVKFVFKLCFLGNETFHDKLFGKRKEHNYENFSFQSVYLNGGISSISQCSDAQESDQRQDKKDKKLNSAHQKLRVNSIALLSLILKLFPSVVESSWEICVTPNILTLDFLEYLRKLKINAEASQLTSADKGQIVNLMRANFGDHSLILLSVFQKNWKVRLSAVQCLRNMISNFQGKKLIDTTESAYMEKLLKQTRSSFVPKSFIIFSGLRNALYFLLFSLHHQKNITIIMEVFKTLSSLCHNCTLVDKMAFEDGVGLLMENYIGPVLAFDWMIPELEELKALCISFLAVLVSTQKKWDQIEQLYLLTSDKSNINHQLLIVLSQRIKSSKSLSDRIITEILTYFTKLPKKYYKSVFYKCMGQESIWTYTCQMFKNQISITFAAFVEEVFKCHFDEKLKNHQENETQINFIPQNRSLKKITLITDEQLGIFLSSFLRFYAKQVNSALYIHLINILTFIDYNQWQKLQFKEAKTFLIHCFDGLTSQKSPTKQQPSKQQQYPSIDSIKTNSLVRLALIKMIGYMSFCPEFHESTYIKKSIKILLQASKQQKSLNSIVKISWGVSNWSKIKNFADSLSDSQLQQCIEYLMMHSQSDKEKIASNCTRGIGFFVSNVNTLKYDLSKCRNNIIKNLSHQILKVRTNSTKTLILILQLKQLSKQQIQDLIPILEQNLLKNNYHLQMETLNLLHKLSNPIKPQRFINICLTILRNLLNHTTMEYQFSQIKTIKDLRKVVLSELFGMEDRLIFEVNKDILPSIYAYFGDCKEENKKLQAKMPERQFERSEQAQNLIFNIKKGDFYDQEKTIMTKAGVGLSFEALEGDLKLIQRIKEFSLLQTMKTQLEWVPLAKMNICGSKVDIQEYIGDFE